MARLHQWIGLAALSLALTGCVSQEKYAALKLERDQLAGRTGQLERDIELSRGEAESLKQQLARIGQGDAAAAAMVANLTGQLADKDSQLGDLRRRYDEAMGKMGQLGTALPVALNNELSAFAQANPDLVEFDSAKGVVKFKSDVTFGPGSAVVTEKAKEVLGRFSEILNSNAASGYELMVAGHTDNTRVSNPATISAGHKDNWYLSAHRAITVAAELFNHRVNSNRLSIAGFADQRPVASNTGEAGKAQNRRVEVLILPTTVRGSVAQTGFAPAAAPVKKPALNLNKDVTSADTRPQIPVNK